MAFQPGNSLGGRPPSGWQSYATRSAFFAENMTAQEIIDLAADKKKLRKRSAFDAMILQNLANALRRGDSHNGFAAVERERFFDRYIGKPKEVETPDDPFKALTSQEIRELVELASRKLEENNRRRPKVIDHEEARRLRPLSETD